MHTISHRDTWAEISLDAIIHNAITFKSSLSENCRFMAVVKADGYGHGAIEVATAAIHAGADYLGIAFLDEALQLRNAGIDKPILVLGYTPPHSVEAAIKQDITITVFSDEVLEEIIACTERLDHRARIHLKVDTGMSRVGVSTIEEAFTLAFKTVSSRLVSLEGMFTHFADADNEDDSFTQQQFQLFKSFIEELEKRHIHIPIKHCCNSAAAMTTPAMHLNMVRIGISLYGLLPFKQIRSNNHPICQAMSFKTKISALKTVAANCPVSYGCTFKPIKDSRIATIPVGYADGLSRLLSNKGYVLVHGQRVPIIGKICMDQTMLDVTSLPHIQVGDEVTLFGWSEESLLSVDEIADYMNTINYEVVCSVGKRVPRVYVRNGQIISAQNHLIMPCRETQVGTPVS
ncbi:alanine racemase [Paenibacillus sp. LMG 31456]|uniref:Alanine racemase n=1 Tax=Paenibacillus foliorum TaxID=2654974 RepID=A0A972GUH9_9BACL|nr:alanine racemase [Paenibacillus foliorum]NOU96568.1 alanine racemase [Paenibacillus foliorum]